MELYPTSSVTVYTQPTALDLWRAAYETGCPAALWRLPNRPEKHLIIHFGDELPQLPADLEDLPAGFAVSPFHNPDNERTLFLRADAHYIFTGDEVDEHVSEIENKQADAFRQAVDRLMAAPASQPTAAPLFTDVSKPDEQRRFEAAVAEATARMKQGEMRKVVISRTKTVQFSTEPDVVQLFDKLCEAYPTAFVSVVWLPERRQVWISATPERLVSVDANGIFKTVSLAGTQSAYDADGRLKQTSEAAWTQKEIEEQALVGRYIIECFKKIRLREYIEEGPKTAIAGNLMHLKSDFTVDTKAVNFPQLGTVMLRLLHPTSAVCGMPRETAKAFIRHHETHDRELYSGFLGPVNIQSESHLFVHIRCLKLEGQTATLYAGAGLTEDSIPEREWHETEMKCQTLLRVMND
ncbi:isochorismate synthase [Nibrella saemangeumensis]